jgi:type I restriction enzyme S subunit
VIAELKPYPEYKDSGLPWLGRVPQHWDLRRMKALFRERAEKGFPDEPMLAATQSNGVVRKADYGARTVTAMKDFHLLKLVETGDFVISLRSFEGGIEIAHCRGIISPAYTVLTPNQSVGKGYYSHFFKSPDFVRSLTLFVTGIREGQNIDYERLSRAYLPLPSVEEQTAIDRFLAWANRKLERAIRAKRTMIALLNEQKHAIVRSVLTHSLDPKVPTKASGTEWLGNIPEHWQVLQIGHFAKVGNGSTPSRSESRYWSSEGYPWLNSGSVNQTEIASTDQFVTEVALRECHLPRVRPGSVLVGITGQGKTRGTCAIVRIEATINQHIAYITARSSIVTPEFLQIELSSAYSHLRQISNDSGSTKGALTCESIKHFKVAIPPLAEQNILTERVRDQLALTNSAIDAGSREIGLIHEYRTRLVADVVTGKLDVREAVAALPDELIEIEPSETVDLATEETSYLDSELESVEASD